ncbi:MAG TPA: shikimate kinase [Fimbriimonadaceae bacterium]|nr:shikimate kinase [Fimbriimonadaceae bacterium]
MTKAQGTPNRVTGMEEVAPIVGATSSFMTRCWILVGMMGVGKSAVGRELAQRTDREFLDTDHMLQTRLGRPVGQLFQIYGESAFRDHETSLLRSLEPSFSILSTGGGIVIRDENWDELRRLGTVLYLKASEEDIIRRLSASKKRRPLLEVADWEERLRRLLHEREALYQKADLVVELEGESIEAAADRAYAAFKEAGR